MYYPCFFYNLAASIQGLNTTGTLVSICQNDKFSFSFLKNTYLGLAQAFTSTAATLGFWYIQRYFKFSTKTMVNKFYLGLSLTLLIFLLEVCCHQYSDYFNPAVGHDRNLDTEVRVGLYRFLSATMFFTRCHFRFHNEWEFWYSRSLGRDVDVNHLQGRTT